MRRTGHLRHDINPSTVQGSTFDVREGALQLQASGLTAGQSIPIEVRVAGKNVNDGLSWAPLVRDGRPIVLSAENNVHVEIVRGTYRLGVGPAVGAVSVSYEEDESQIDDRLMYTYIVNQPLSAAAPAPIAANNHVIPVTRCDATTGAQVTLLACSVGGVPSIVGYVGPSGAVVAGAYPGTLGTCTAAAEFDHSFFCDPVTGNRVLITTTYSSARANRVRRRSRTAQVVRERY
jgi:hypothetical protein